MSERGRLLIVGAGAQGRVVLEAARSADPEGEFGFLDDNASLHGTAVLGVAIVGPVLLAAKSGDRTVLAIGHNRVRLDLAARLSSEGVRWGQVIHASAVISPTAEIGPGTVVLPAAVVHTGAQIGSHVIINTGAIVEHDCVLEDGSSVSPGARMGGRVHIERGVFIATGVTLAPRVRVGAGSIVGAGAVVVRDIPAGVLAYGSPARPVRAASDAKDWRRLL